MAIFGGRLKAFVGLIFLTGCTNSAPSSNGTQENKAGTNGGAGNGQTFIDQALVAENKPLPPCDSTRSGKVLYLTSDKTFFICAAGEWTQLDMKGKDGAEGKAGAVGKSAPELLVTMEEVAADSTCPSGGKKLSSVPDRNGNGKVDPEEKSEEKSMITCNPVNPIVTTKPASNSSCPFGGITVLSGRDLNGDGKLDEINSPEKDTITKNDVCSGQDGKSAVPMVTEFRNLPGNSYFFGCRSYYVNPLTGRYTDGLAAILVVTGKDVNANNVLDPSEEVSAKYTLVCLNRKEDFSYYDLYPSDDIFRTTAVKGNNPGEIDITIDLAPEKINLSRIQLTIVRKEGGESPTCGASDAFIMNFDYNGAFKMSFDYSSEHQETPTKFKYKDAVVPGSTYSYAVCLSNAFNRWTRSISGVQTDSGPTSCVHRLILTEPKFTSYDLGGLSGADQECFLAGGSTGKWRAILSSASVDAKNRITINGNICNSEGRVIATDAKHFFGQPLSDWITFVKSSLETDKTYSLRHIMSGSKTGGTKEDDLPANFEWNTALDRISGNYAIENRYPAFPYPNTSTHAFPFGIYGSKTWDNAVPMSLMCISGQ